MENLPQGNRTEPIEPIMYMLFGGMVFFTAILIGIEVWFKDDGQVFQVVAGLLTGFSGAFFGRLKTGQQKTDTALAPGTSQLTSVVVPPAPVTPAQE